MPTEILMPALSPTMEEGKLAKWLVREGDAVASGDLLAEIETDKATMEFEAVDEGVVAKLLVPEGAEGVAVNTPIAVLADDGESAEDAACAPAAEAPAAAEPTSAPDEAAPAAAPAPASAPTSAPTPAPAPVSDAQKGARVFASPLARRVAEQKGVDLAQVTGSGPHGRIVKSDVEGARPGTGGTAASAAAPPPAGAGAEAVMALYRDRAHEEVALDGMRRTIAARLTEAKQTIPHFYLRRDVRLDALLAARKGINAAVESRGVKLSVNDFVIKACALALQDVPDCNAVWAGDRILRIAPSDVAVAVAIDGGLLTPVLRDAETKSLSTLSAEMKDMAARARDRKLAPHEYQGGSFAISNLGMFGVDSFDAVINPPHGSILAVGAGARRPVIGEDGEIAAATVMSLTLSVDHRVIDGALGAQFLQRIAENLEQPLGMLAG